MPVELICLAPRPMARRRLIAIPFAGGGPSVFQPWVPHVPADTELFGVLLPGRERAARAAPLSDWSTLVPEIERQIAALPSLPFALFGHSLGALIALEVAHAVADRGLPLTRLCVAGRPWPGAGRPAVETPMATVSDEVLLARMAERYGALPASLAHPDIAEMALPILRADMVLLEGYQHRSGRQLSAPISVVHGERDPITAAADPMAWRAETTGTVTAQTVDAGHFFVAEAATALIAASLSDD